jgi:hypothetical protein
MATEAWRTLVIAQAMLLGCPEPLYDDYGHPERAAARKYWRIYSNEPDQLYTLCDHTKADVMHRWLIRHGFTVTQSLDFRRTR